MSKGTSRYDFDEFQTVNDLIDGWARTGQFNEWTITTFRRFMLMYRQLENENIELKQVIVEIKEMINLQKGS